MAAYVIVVWVIVIIPVRIRGPGCFTIATSIVTVAVAFPVIIGIVHIVPAIPVADLHSQVVILIIFIGLCALFFF